MKLPKTMFGIASLVAVVTTGCYTERVVREPAGATTTRTTVRETVSVDEPEVSTSVTAAPRVEHRVVTPAPSVRETVVVEAPPAPRVETVGVPPTAEHVWIPGHWTREGDRWVWVGGRFEARPSTTSVYVPGHWEMRGNGYVWREGYWK